MTAGNARRRDRSTLKIQFAAQILVNGYPSKNTGGSAGSKSGTTLLREEQVDLICQGTKSAPRHSSAQGRASCARPSDYRQLRWTEALVSAPELGPAAPFRGYWEVTSQRCGWYGAQHVVLLPDHPAQYKPATPQDRQWPLATRLGS
jgi:hypothetical protein